ncbi:MAG: 4-alpha-glucanotransferase [Nocardioidaceae bacterium]|nr:4-alpha-glucanotransferase [Nocardioidaceae bacterium]
MTSDDWGIQARWIDADDQAREVPEATIQRLRQLIGRPPTDLEDRAPVVARPGQDLRLGRVAVRCEDGSRRRVDGEVPGDFPLGYHRMLSRNGPGRALIVSPGRCWLPHDWRAWGWSVQLYATRSQASWGIGDLADLRRVRQWAQDLGAGFLMVNPLHAVAPTLPQEASPYLPTSRRFLNPLYLRVEEVPGADTVDLSDLAEQARALNAVAEIDRDAVFELKREALRRVFAAGRDDGFEQWWRRPDPTVVRFALWSALAERHGPDWHDWPADLQQPDEDTTALLVRENQEAVDFHAWQQWSLDHQLREACQSMVVVQDLPIGVAGGGADAWSWRDLLPTGVMVGAPADAFNTTGQVWGSPPLVPWRLRESEYDAFVESIRATMSRSGGLRIDHVLGLFRQWWVPDGTSPHEGAYVRYPSDELLDIVALESNRARAVVVGEDLGTVETGVRGALTERGLLSYRLLWFEDEEPAGWPEAAMAAVTTHDLPTVAGLWSGADLVDQREHGVSDEAALVAGRQQFLARLAPAGLAPDASADDAVIAAHRLLARAPSTLLVATLEDACVDERRPNLPGITGRANWSLALRLPLESLVEHPTALAVAEILRSAVSEPRGVPRQRRQPRQWRRSTSC